MKKNSFRCGKIERPINYCTLYKTISHTCKVLSHICQLANSGNHILLLNTLLNYRVQHLCKSYVTNRVTVVYIYVLTCFFINKQSKSKGGQVWTAIQGRQKENKSRNAHCFSYVPHIFAHYFHQGAFVAFQASLL